MPARCRRQVRAATWQDVRVPRRTLADRPTTRRTVLAGLLGTAGAAVTALLTGCDPFGSGQQAPPGTNELSGFATDTAAIAARYDATLAVHPALTTTLGPIRDAHRAHVNALAQAMGIPIMSPPAAGEPPADQASAVGALVTAEKSAHDAAVTACIAATTRYAGLLGSIAAARATHLEVLS
jgi:hypothetical protein